MAVQLTAAVGSGDGRDVGKCQGCGASVSRQFRHVFGDQDDVAHRCLQCDTGRRVSKGSAAGRDVEVVDPQDDPGRATTGHDHRGRNFK